MGKVRCFVCATQAIVVQQMLTSSVVVLVDSDRCDPEMGLLKNMVRRHLLTETVGNMHRVRVTNYKEVAILLRQLGAETPQG